MQQATRSSILRHAAGGSSKGLHALREARRAASKAGTLGKFWAKVHREIGGRSDPAKHIHPRHLRPTR